MERGIEIGPADWWGTAIEAGLWAIPPIGLMLAFQKMLEGSSGTDEAAILGGLLMLVVLVIVFLYSGLVGTRIRWRSEDALLSAIVLLVWAALVAFGMAGAGGIDWAMWFIWPVIVGVLAGYGVGSLIRLKWKPAPRRGTVRLALPSWGRTSDGDHREEEDVPTAVRLVRVLPYATMVLLFASFIVAAWVYAGPWAALLAALVCAVTLFRRNRLFGRWWLRRPSIYDRSKEWRAEHRPELEEAARTLSSVSDDAGEAQRMAEFLGKDFDMSGPDDD